MQLHVKAPPLPVRGDEASLRRLLLILVDNAVKFTPRGGKVAVTGSRDGTHVIVSVADTGAGIHRKISCMSSSASGGRTK